MSRELVSIFRQTSEGGTALLLEEPNGTVMLVFLKYDGDILENTNLSRIHQSTLLALGAMIEDFFDALPDDALDGDLEDEVEADLHAQADNTH